MATLGFTPNLMRHLDTAPAQVEGSSVAEVLHNYFQTNPRMRGYILDDQGALRKHVAVFINQEMIRDPQGLSDEVGAEDHLFIVQALAGG